ncbi:hypothetical protein Sjap_024317 [Stephania japonica]|uniref:Uncharacterized protein n=1 Tax=Stephania japonica TaxID=461633 RepID=A0AAP0HQ08_9MAGN
MGNTEKLMNQIMELKFTSKSLQRQARKCEKEEKSEKLKVKKAIEKGNMDGARIYAENSIRKRNEQMNYLRLASRLDAVVSRLDTQAKMTTISKSMSSIVKSLESSLTTGNLQKMSETMDQFEKQFVNMEVQAEFMESSMAGSTSLSTPEGDVNSLMQQVADDYGLEVSVGLPQAAAHAIPVKAPEKVDEDDLSRRLAELKARGKCEKEEKSEKPKVTEAIQKGNMDGARMYAENSTRKRNEQMNYPRLASRLDAVVSHLDTQAKMTTISKYMSSILKLLES